MIAVTAEEKDYKKEIREKTGMPMLWLGMASMVMLFAAMTSAVVISMGSPEWMEFEMPGTFLLSTIVIALSSITYGWIYRQAKRGDFSKLVPGVSITLGLGLLFAVLQFVSWSQLTAQGIFFAGSASIVSGSYLYVLSGLHLAHLIGGLISLVVVLVKSSRGRYDSENLLGLQMSSTYWHFLGGLWVYLYIFLNFIAL